MKGWFHNEVISYIIINNYNSFVDCVQLLFLTFTSLLLFFNGCILYFTQEDFIKKAFNSLGLLHYEWCYNPVNPMNKKTVVKMSLRLP